MRGAVASSLSILLVEDEPLIAMMMEDIVETLGHRVAGTCDTVSGALEAIERGGFDLAILDVRLRDGISWPVADALADGGHRYILATGGHVEAPPVRHAGAPVLAKPFTIDDLSAQIDGIHPA